MLISKKKLIKTLTEQRNQLHSPEVEENDHYGQ